MESLPTPPGASPMCTTTAASSFEVQTNGGGPNIPIRRLPNELLGDIFLLLRNAPGMRSSLSLVCRHWRLIIFQIPQFWSKLVVFPRRALTICEAVERLKLLIKRSGIMPLDVDWGCLMRPKAALSLALANCLLENTSVNRWHSLRLGETGEIPSHKVQGIFDNLQDLVIDQAEEGDFIGLIAASAPKLSMLKLPTAGISSSSEHDFMTNLVGPGTLLRTAVIHRRLSITYTTHRLHVSSLLHLFLLPQLKELIVDRLTPSDMRLGTFCPNLESLTVRNCVEQCASLDINIRSLLHLAFHGPNYYALSRVDAPKLQTLCIGKRGFNQASQTNSFPEALDSPMYQLSPTILHIDCPADITTIMTAVELSPGLQHLVISLYVPNHPWRSIFTALNRRRTAPSNEGQFLGWQLCEHLVSLQIHLHWGRRDVEEVNSIAIELLANRSIGEMRRVSFEWNDGFVVAVEL